MYFKKLTPAKSRLLVLRLEGKRESTRSEEVKGHHRARRGVWHQPQSGMWTRTQLDSARRGRVREGLGPREAAHRGESEELVDLWCEEIHRKYNPRWVRRVKRKQGPWNMPQTKFKGGLRIARGPFVSFVFYEGKLEERCQRMPPLVRPSLPC